MSRSGKPSVAVIGAGVAGVSFALRAAELGCEEVTVLERAHVAAGSSGLSAGVFNINATDPLNVEIRVRTRAMLDLLERENGLHLAHIGHLRLGRSEHHVELLREVIAMQADLGVETSVLLDPEQILERVPDLRVDDVLVGLWNPWDGHLDGPLLCGALVERAEALGVKIVPKQPVEAWRKREGGGHVLTTPEGEHAADVVVNAAGPWATRMGEMLGAALPLVSQVHDVIKVKLPDTVDYTVPMVQEAIPGEEAAIYFRQDGPDSLIGGEHTYSVIEELGSADPDHYRKTIPWETWEEVASRISARLPVDGLGFEPGWTGLYPISADGRPIIGPYEHDESIVACGGLGADGVTAGITLGRVAAEWAVLGEPETIGGAEVLLPDRPTLAEVKAEA
ncbi:MAG: FAD-binding oxidoreductase [Actinobacteria bacterium]|nr:FAD-binding oxidoreductase [Actinomycetota bacterium]